MKTFDFTVERKVITWDIAKVSIEAETIEDAIERCKKENYDYVYIYDIDSDYADVIKPNQNENFSTFIISQSDGTVLYQNGL